MSMKEVIESVNEEFRALLDKMHSKIIEEEKELESVNNEIDSKANIASEYRNSVENSRNTISSLEQDITKLKQDLQDLEDKFGSTGFKETIAAANKEINSKIIEKNSLIMNESRNIRELQNKAQLLKSQLIELKNRKDELTKNLDNYNKCFAYYNKRTDEMLVYAVENADNLGNYVNTDDTDELLDNTEDYSNIDVNNIVDGKVFEEIAALSNSKVEPTEADFQNVIKGESVTDTQKTDETKQQNVTTTQETVDDVINETNNILKDYDVSDIIDNTNNVDNKTLDDNNTEETITSKPEEISLEPDNINTETPSEEQMQVQETTQVEQEKPVEENTPEEDPVVDSIADNFINSLTKSNVGEQEKYEETTPQYTNNIKQDDNIVTEKSFEKDTNTFEDNIKKLGLDINYFNSQNIKDKFNYNNAKKIIDILDKHMIDLNNLKAYPDLIVTISPENLDHILDLLDLAGTSKDTIKYIFKYLDKININEFEISIKNKTDSIASILNRCIDVNTSDDIGSYLGLNKNEQEILKANAKNDYTTMCKFKEIVKANYDVLKNLKINDLNKCITEHPHRFIMNPDKFFEILDKYDTEDLIRCINKNVAVIDKL